MRKMAYLALATSMLIILFVPAVSSQLADRNAESSDYARVPENDTRISNHVVTFGWNSLKGAKEYLLQVDNNIDFSSPEIEATTRNVAFTSTSLRDNTYYWRVKERGATDSTFWLWEETSRFTVITSSSTTASVKDLGVPHLQQHKDTALLCLSGCVQTGKHGWDVDHESRGDMTCDHCDWYCVRASIAMISRYYGGSLSQDRISYYILGEGAPEDDLGHGRGLYPDETTEALSWALYGYYPYRMSGKPNFAQIKAWIDEGRPILRRNVAGDWHATVIDGYEESWVQLVHIIDPWTGNEYTYEYANLAVYEVWVPPWVSAARSDETALALDSDGDGIVDFDETNRFGTDPNSADSDDDGALDKAEIAYYTFTTHNPDPDNDGIRMELDPDEISPFDITIKAYCNIEDMDPSVSILMDSSPTGYTTPHTFQGLFGTHTFTVPETDPRHPFKGWSTGETSTTVAVTSGGTYTAFYGNTQSDTKLYIEPKRIPEPGQIGHPGDEYIVAVKVNRVENLFEAGFRIHYEPYVSILVASEFTEGTFLSEDGTWPTSFAYSVNAYQGTADISIVRLPKAGQRIGVSGSGTLLTFKLTVVEAGECPIYMTDDTLLDSSKSPISHSTYDSYYYGVTASLIRVEMLPSRKVHVGDTIQFNCKVRNNGDLPLSVRVRFDISRAEDGRMIRIYSGQEYLGWKPTRTEYLYVNDFTGHYGEGQGWNYVGDPPYLNAVGDGNYIQSNEPYALSGRYDFEDMSPLDRNECIGTVELEAYTLYEWGLDQECDIDAYMRKPYTEAPPTAWVGSLWGDGAWGWHGVRWITDTVDDILPEVKTEYGLNGTRVRYVMYWTADELPHGTTYIDAMRLKVTIPPKLVDPQIPQSFVIDPYSEADLPPVLWVAQTDDIGHYQLTATIEYTLTGLRWINGNQKTFSFSIAS